MSNGDKKDKKKANKADDASDRNARNRRERIAMRKARKRVTDWRMERAPKDIQDHIVTLRHADGTVIVKDTCINIKDRLYGLPNGTYHYVNDKTDSTHFFSVHDRGVDFLGARLADGNMYPYLGGGA